MRKIYLYCLMIVIVFLFSTGIAECQNKIYVNPETAVVWTDAATGGDELLDLGGLAAGAVRMGSYLDLGAAPRSAFYRFEFLVDGFDTDPVVGQAVNVFFSQSMATTNFDGNPTTDPGDATEGVMTLNQTKNVLPAGSAIVYAISQSDELKISGMVYLPSRYVSPVIHNGTDDALESTSETHKLTLWAIPQEIQ